MRLARVQTPQQAACVGLLQDEQLLLTPHDDPLAVIGLEQLALTGERLEWGALYAGRLPGYRLLPPIETPEVWACGFTYQRGPQFGRSPMIPKGPAYTHAIESGRPEIFFKTTGFRVVGHNESVGIRGDSHYGAVEAELCLILDAQSRPVLFTAGNDVSAWDIEAQNPLWLAQSKTFEACCALGPLAVTREHLPPEARVRCRVTRGETVLFEDSVPLAQLHWSFEELAAFARAYTPLPPGTVLMTGTAVIRPDAESLEEGDVVAVEIDGIGTLRNPARRLSPGVDSQKYTFKR
jgi:2-dehydro-3-deoxy-D-arabinonate dehydratase